MQYAWLFPPRTASARSDAHICGRKRIPEKWPFCEIKYRLGYIYPLIYVDLINSIYLKSSINYRTIKIELENSQKNWPSIFAASEYSYTAISSAPSVYPGMVKHGRRSRVIDGVRVERCSGKQPTAPDPLIAAPPPCISRDVSNMGRWPWGPPQA